MPSARPYTTGRLNAVQLRRMVATYRDVRRRVWNDATRTANTSPEEHRRNQSVFRNALTTICEQARLDRYAGATEVAAIRLWHEMWTKIRYAGFRARTATDEIAGLERGPGHFDDFRMFGSRAWNIRGTNRGHDWDRSGTGQQARDFLEKRRLYAKRGVVRNVSKLKKTVAAARAFTSFVDQRPARPILDFVTGQLVDPWSVYAHLEKTEYGGGLTAIHLLMDLGYPFVKPDVVVSSLFLKWGWLHLGDPTLPSGLEARDLKGKGRFGRGYAYDKPRMFRVAIDVAQQVAEALDADDLRSDIGWCTNNALREFDLFVVKFGQEPEPQLGIVRQLEVLDDSVPTKRASPCASRVIRKSHPAKRTGSPMKSTKKASPQEVGRRFEQLRSKLRSLKHEFDAPVILATDGEVRDRPQIRMRLDAISAVCLNGTNSRVNRSVQVLYEPASGSSSREFQVLAERLESEGLVKVKSSSTKYFYFLAYPKAPNDDATIVDRAIALYRKHTEK